MRGLNDVVARAWARAIVDLGTASVSRSEIEAATRKWTAELLSPTATTNPERAVIACALRIGQAMVEANLTDPSALGATLATLDTHLPPAVWPRDAASAIAVGYAQALRQVTLAEQERVAQSILLAYARLESRARRNVERFEAIFSRAAVGIGVSDVNGRIVQANQALADMLGYSLDEICSLSVPDLAHPTDSPEIWKTYERMSRGEIEHVRFDKACYRKDGAEVWADLTASLIRDDDGKPEYGIAILDDITDRHNLQARLRHQALHDPLTGLPNRTMFADRLARAVTVGLPEPSARVGVCYVDLDGFQRINDTLGHDVGDQLLIAVAGRLAECARRRGHLTARVGGDEFVILVERSSGVEQLAALAEAVLASVAAPVKVGPHRLRVSASVGVVERPAKGAKLSEILKAADVTLYRAKALGRGRWALYDPTAGAELVARYELCAALPDALERGEFSLVYQPIVDLPDGTPRGVEALVRWHHPQLGTLTPDRFIGPAEETGFIVGLGRQVLWNACREASSWQARIPGCTGSELFVSVNVAAAQARESDLVTDVARILAETGLHPSRLQLELTESALMSTSGAPLDALRALSDMGVRVAIDDFGTGYSNLAYLRSLPVHGLKLPQPLVNGLRDPVPPGDGRPDVDERIVDALVRLAHAIDLVVVAEGVEMALQAERLGALGCDRAQGWYYARPCPPEELPDLIERLMLATKPAAAPAEAQSPAKLRAPLPRRSGVKRRRG